MRDCSYFYDLIDELDWDYRRKTKSIPLKPSHWIFDDELMKYPIDIIKEVDVTRENKLLEYLSYEGLEKLKVHASILYNATGHEYNIGFNVKTDQFTFFAGATQALFQVLLTLREEGHSNILIITPCYFSLREAATRLGYCVELFPTYQSNTYLPIVDDIRKIILEKEIDIIAITNPIIPVGIDIPHDIYSKILRICKENRIVCIIDEAYYGLPWNASSKHPTIRRIDNVIIVRSLSKIFLLNGARFSHVLANEELIKKMEHDLDFIFGEIPQFQSHLAVVMYNTLYHELTNTSHNCNYLLSIRNHNMNIIKSNYIDCISIIKHSEVHIIPPNSGMFGLLTFPSISSIYTNDIEIIREILYAKGVLVIPGSRFSICKNNPFSIRINFAQRKAELLEGVKRVVEFIQSKHHDF